MDVRTDTPDVMVVVPRREVVDLVELALSAAARLPESDPLARELRGAANATIASAVPEP